MEIAAQRTAAMANLRGRNWMRALRKISGLEKTFMAANSHHFSAREARVNLLERFRGALHSANRRAGHDQIANQRGERGIAAGESKIHAGRAARRVRRRTRFRDAIARGEPAEKLIRASRDANADLPAR